jgi:hypothetical protein
VPQEVTSWHVRSSKVSVTVLWRLRKCSRVSFGSSLLAEHNHFFCTCKAFYKQTLKFFVFDSVMYVNLLECINTFVLVVLEIVNLV